jgi:hypothetical protein
MGWYYCKGELLDSEAQILTLGHLKSSIYLVANYAPG